MLKEDSNSRGPRLRHGRRWATRRTGKDQEEEGGADAGAVADVGEGQVVEGGGVAGVVVVVARLQIQKARHPPTPTPRLARSENERWSLMADPVPVSEASTHLPRSTASRRRNRPGKPHSAEATNGRNIYLRGGDVYFQQQKKHCMT